TPVAFSTSRTLSSSGSLRYSLLWMGSAMWMIELAMNTITADSRMGSHNAVIGTMVPPSEFETEKKGPKFRQSLLWMETPRQICSVPNSFIAGVASFAAFLSEFCGEYVFVFISIEAIVCSRKVRQDFAR